MRLISRLQLEQIVWRRLSNLWGAWPVGALRCTEGTWSVNLMGLRSHSEMNNYVEKKKQKNKKPLLCRV